jgi:hypothetical protein
MHPCRFGDSDIACVWYSSVFNPRLYLVDNILGSPIEMQNSYYLELVGGGTDVNRLDRWSRETIEKYNPFGNKLSSDTIFLPIGQNDYTIPTYGPNSKGIRWRCRGSSPCSNTPPGQSGSPPVYYFLVNMTVLQSNQRVSYCSLTTTFPIGVVGVPLALKHKITAISVSCSVCIIIFFIYLWFNQRTYHLQLGLRSQANTKKGVRFEDFEEDFRHKGTGRVFPEEVFSADGKIPLVEEDNEDYEEDESDDSISSNEEEGDQSELEIENLDYESEDGEEQEFSHNGRRLRGSISSLNHLIRK